MMKNKEAKSKKVQTLSQFLPKFEPKHKNSITNDKNHNDIPLLSKSFMDPKTLEQKKKDQKKKNKKILLNVSLNHKKKIKENLNNSNSFTPKSDISKDENLKEESILKFLDPFVLEKLPIPKSEKFPMPLTQDSEKLFSPKKNKINLEKKQKEIEKKQQAENNLINQDINFISESKNKNRLSVPNYSSNIIDLVKEKNNKETGKNIKKIAKKYNIKYGASIRRSLMLKKEESNIDFKVSMRMKELEKHEIRKSYEIEKDEITRNKNDKDLSEKKLELENINFLLEEQILKLKGEVERLNIKIKKNKHSNKVHEKIRNLFLIIKKALPKFVFFDFHSSYKSIDSWLEKITKKNKNLTKKRSSVITNKLTKSDFLIFHKSKFQINILDEQNNSNLNLSNTFDNSIHSKKNGSFIKQSLKFMLDEQKTNKERESKLNFKKKARVNLDSIERHRKNSRIMKNNLRGVKKILTPGSDLKLKVHPKYEVEDIQNLQFDVQSLKKEMKFLKHILKKHNIK